MPVGHVSKSTRHGDVVEATSKTVLNCLSIAIEYEPKKLAEKEQNR